MTKIQLNLTERLKKDYKRLPIAVKKKFQKQMRFLAENPRHPSLNIHRIRGTIYWEFYVDISYRCVFSKDNPTYNLIAVGSHKIIDEFARKS